MFSNCSFKLQTEELGMGTLFGKPSEVADQEERRGSGLFIHL